MRQNNSFWHFHILFSKNSSLQALHMHFDNTVLYRHIPAYLSCQVPADIILQPKADETTFADGFMIAGVDTVTVDRSWEPVWGEYSSIRDHFREMAVNLKAPQTKDQPEREMIVRFRLFDDGLGFRYEFPVQEGTNYLTVKDELTEFNFPGNHKLYCIPKQHPAPHSCTAMQNRLPVHVLLLQ